MAVTLPSDLVADVMRAADPARRTAAAARLTSMSGTTAKFETLVDAEIPKALPIDNAGVAPVLSAPPGTPARADDQTPAYQGFERMVLRNLFETLLPEEDSGAFGGGPSAGIWRSMAADQLAGVYAANGGVGIAGMLASSGSGPAPQRDAQWPYFSMDALQVIGKQG
ncbi:rod-binding protein [Aestuariivirga sp.]|uniref:rod-binding protein n=1 Tax=Aestuariivirga sp. TaxID=2650926 RepID=UPI0025C30983|nr:rod-binding protein [Aestuariivirga sp.]MCA3554262.1 rod-binding protein [Aestuariivirga sp.]